MKGEPSTLLQSYGAGLVGTFIGLVIYGITVTQFWFYFTTFFARDEWVLQLFVAGLAIVETLYIIVCVIWVYIALVIDFGHYEKLMMITWPIALHPTLLGLITSSVQVFFAWRIYALTRMKWVAVLITLVAIFGTVAGIIFSVFTGILHPNVADQAKLKALAISWNISTNVADIAITFTLTWYLYRQRVEFGQTDTLLNQIMKLTIQNGLMTTIWSLLNLLLFFVTPPGVFRVLLISSPIIFVLGALALLNARHGWRERHRVVPPSFFISDSDQPATADCVLSMHPRNLSRTDVEASHVAGSEVDSVKDVGLDRWN